jgi:hypothetical protein
MSSHLPIADAASASTALNSSFSLAYLHSLTSALTSTPLRNHYQLPSLPAQSPLLSDSFPPPLEHAQQPVAISAANPFTFVARSNQQPAEISPHSIAHAPSAHALGSATAASLSALAVGRSYNSDLIGLKLQHEAMVAQKELAEVQKRKAAAAQRAEQKRALESAAQRVIAKATAGGSTASAIDVEESTAGKVKSDGTATDDPSDLNSAPLPSTYAAVHAREMKGGLSGRRATAKLPARRSDWSLRQRMMPHLYAGDSARARSSAAKSTSASSLHVKGAAAAAASMESQSRWIAKKRQPVAETSKVSTQRASSSGSAHSTQSSHSASAPATSSSKPQSQRERLGLAPSIKPHLIGRVSSMLSHSSSHTSQPDRADLQLMSNSAASASSGMKRKTVASESNGKRQHV